MLRTHSSASESGAWRVSPAAGRAFSRAMLLSGALLLPVSTSWAQAQPTPPAQRLQADPSFADFPHYVGTLGSRKIELLLGAKTDDPSGLHGEYHWLDTGQVVLVAGERDDDTLQLEESDDGTHITGQWVGQFSNNGGLTGERSNDDETDTQPYTLQLVGPTRAQ